MAADKDNADATRERGPSIDVTLIALQEQRFIRRDGSSRHIYFNLRVSERPPDKPADRTPLALALVLDRSGSMSGDKLVTAKRAAIAVMDRLTEQDRIAVVVFDDKIDVVQSAAPATSDIKAHVRAELNGIQARSNTALHEGWLTGRQSIASDDLTQKERWLARCFLLTDGLANVGLSDPEQIAAEAAGIRGHARIGTSTFGIGADYNEGLLGPMAVAGGGQFHHLRTAAEIAQTFLGELGELMAVVASHVCLELEFGPGVAIRITSAYRASRAAPDADTLIVPIGDLLGGEERHVVVRFGFPASRREAGQTVRARLTWLADGIRHNGDWQEVRFAYADDETCAAETPDLMVMHWVGLHHARKVMAEATEYSRRGNLHGAQEAIRKVEEQIAAYAGADTDLRAALRELAVLRTDLSERPLDSMTAKELRNQSLRMSRGQRDLRSPGPPPRQTGLPGADPDLPERNQAAEMVRRHLLLKVDWPSPLPQNVAAGPLRDLYQGCLLWGAVGDALGRAVEGMDPAKIRTMFGPQGIWNYVAWHGWQGGPRGTITDDTQLTIEVARTLIANPERFDSVDFAGRLISWLPHGRGKGRATIQAVEALARGEPWWTAGLAANSAGNGAAMRAAPVGLARALCPTPWKLRRDAVLSAFPTHTHPVGVAGAVVMAAGVAWCLRQSFKQPKQMDPRAFVDFVVRTIEGTEPEPTLERRPGGKAIRLAERIAELPDLLHLSPEDAFAYLWNGAFALESVPAALYCFLRTPDDPRQTILTAVNAGHDADSVASMAGNLAGAWNGADCLRREEPEWWAELEYREEIILLADGLLEVALKYRGDDLSLEIM